MKHISVLMQFVLLYVAVCGPAYACKPTSGVWLHHLFVLAGQYENFCDFHHPSWAKPAR